MWFGVRSNEKSVCPNQLDHVVAGGLSLDELDKLECVVKECGEEAGFDIDVARRAVEGGMVMYEGNDNWCYEERVNVGGGVGGLGGIRGTRFLRTTLRYRRGSYRSLLMERLRGLNWLMLKRLWKDLLKARGRG